MSSAFSGPRGPAAGACLPGPATEEGEDGGPRVALRREVQGATRRRAAPRARGPAQVLPGEQLKLNQPLSLWAER